MVLVVSRLALVCGSRDYCRLVYAIECSEGKLPKR